jgi:hypothetical protein
MNPLPNLNLRTMNPNLNLNLNLRTMNPLPNLSLNRPSWSLNLILLQTMTIITPPFL